MLSVLVFPATSRAVTVMTLAPGLSATAAIDHAVVPAAVPLAPRSLVQLTCDTPKASDAVPPIATLSFPVECAVAVLGVVMATTGASLSVIVAVTLLVVLLPAASCAVMAITFAPGFSEMPATDHAVVPVAVPLPPRSLTQVTCVTPTSSLAVPLADSVARAVDDVAAGVAIVSAGPWPSVLVTVRMSVAMLPPESRAVTVMTFVPTLTGTPGALHVDVPVALPLPPRLFVQVTLEMPPSSVAVPPSAIVAADVVMVDDVVGDVIETVGAFVSGTVKSIAPLHGPAPEALDARTDHAPFPACSATPGLTRHTAPVVVHPAWAGVRSS